MTSRFADTDPAESQPATATAHTAVSERNVIFTLIWNLSGPGGASPSHLQAADPGNTQLDDAARRGPQWITTTTVVTKSIQTDPLVRANVRRVNLNGHALPDQAHRQHEPGMRSFTNEPSDYAAQRPADDLDQASLSNQGTRVEPKLALDERSNALDLVLWNRRRPPLERDERHDSLTRQNRQRLARAETRKAITGEQRPVDALLPVLPAAPSGDRR